MKPAKPMDLPAGLTADQWERAFREVEKGYARNKSRRWVLVILRDRLLDEVEGTQRRD